VRLLFVRRSKFRVLDIIIARVVSGLGGPGEAEEVVKEVPVEEVSAGCGGPEAEDGQGDGGCDEGW